MIGLPLLLAQLIVSTANGCVFTKLTSQPPTLATVTYAASRLWAVDVKNGITYFWQEPNWKKMSTTHNFKIKQVASCSNNEVYSVSTDGSFRHYSKTYEAWSEALPTTAKKLKTISCGRDGKAKTAVFGLAVDGSLYKFIDSKWYELEYDERSKSRFVSISADGELIWAINTKGEVKLKRADDPGTTPLGFNMVSIFTYNRAVYGINTKANLVMLKDDIKNWDIIEKGVTGFTVSSNHLFVIKNDVVYSALLSCLPA